MSSVHASVSVVGGNEQILQSRPAPPRDVQELWLALAARAWRSLVLVPADPAGSSAELARSLASAAAELGDANVTASADGTLDPGTALALVEGGAPSSRVLVAIPPVLLQPRGVGIARRADAVVACVQRGRTRIADVRRTLELVRSDRFVGCVLVR